MSVPVPVTARSRMGNLDVESLFVELILLLSPSASLIAIALLAALICRLP